MFQSRRRNLHWGDLDMSEVELTKLISHFALNNRSEGKSPRTESCYTEMLSDYIRWLRLTGIRETLSGLDVTSAREFILYQQGKGLSPYTIQGRVRALKASSSWLFAEGYTPARGAAFVPWLLSMTIRGNAQPSRWILPWEDAG